jgi:hypothetical protein
MRISKQWMLMWSRRKLIRFGLLSGLMLVSACGDDTRTADEAAYSLAAGSGSSGCLQDASIQWHHAPANALNASVYRAAKVHLGAYVMNGNRHECTDLVAKALRTSNARERWNNTSPVWPRPGADDYQWGQFVGSVSASDQRVVPAYVTPGDVVQFKNVNTLYRWRPTSTQTRSASKSAAHHTAIVTSVSRDRKHICVFEQNPGVVSYGWYPVTAMTSGTMWFYRPVAR